MSYHRHLLPAIIFLSAFFSSAFLHAQNTPWEPAYQQDLAVEDPMQRLADGSILASRSDGLLRSTDNGEHWTYVATFNRVTSIAVDSAGHVFAAASSSAIYRSDDTGKTWTFLSSQPPQQDVGITVFVVDSRNYLYTATGRGIYRSSDAGRSWKDLGQNIGLARAIGIDHDDRIFITVHNKGVYRSTDAGEHWDSVSAFQFTKYSVTPDNTMLGGQPGQGLFRSTDQGESWIITNDTLGIDDVEGIDSDPQGVVYVAATDWSPGSSPGLGVLRSTDNGKSFDQFLIGKNIQGIEVSSNDGFLISTRDELYRSTDQGKTWDLINSFASLYPDAWLASNSDGDVFAGTQIGVYHFINTGNVWSELLKKSLPWPAQPVSMVQVDGNDSVWALMSSGELSHSTTNGTTWRPARAVADNRQIISFAANSRGNVFAVARHPDSLRNDRYMLYRLRRIGDQWEVTDIPAYPRSWTVPAAADNGDIYVGTDAGVYQSKDDGVTWNLAFPRPDNADKSHPMTLKGGTVFIATSAQPPGSYQLYRSTDRGASWKNIESPSGGPVNVMGADSRGNIFAANDSAVYYSTGQGGDWKWFSDGLENEKVRTFTAIANGYMLAGTSNGIYRNLLTLSSVGEFPLSGGKGSLEQNIPNPVRTATTIRFMLPSAQSVTVGVYDALGREIALLVNGRKGEGSHEVIFDAAGLPEGVYFYRLRVGASISTRAMTIVR